MCCEKSLLGAINKYIYLDIFSFEEGGVNG